MALQLGFNKHSFTREDKSESKPLDSTECVKAASNAALANEKALKHLKKLDTMAAKVFKAVKKK